jgi:hypothetical protein
VERERSLVKLAIASRPNLVDNPITEPHLIARHLDDDPAGRPSRRHTVLAAGPTCMASTAARPYDPAYRAVAVQAMWIRVLASG